MDELEPYIEAKAKCAGTRGWIWQNALELSISITRVWFYFSPILKPIKHNCKFKSDLFYNALRFYKGKS